MTELIRKYDYRLYFGLLRKIDDRRSRKVLYIVLAPLLLVCGVYNIILEKTIDRLIVKRELSNFHNKQYKNKLSFVACGYNESR